MIYLLPRLSTNKIATKVPKQLINESGNDAINV